MSPSLRAYLRLEAAMLELDQRDEHLSDQIRDAMDPIYYALTADEIAFLNERKPQDIAFPPSASLSTGAPQIFSLGISPPPSTHLIVSVGSSATRKVA